MFQDIKDEVLSGEPRYTIKNSSGNVLNDNVDISLKTSITQEGTPVNRALFRNLQGDLYTQDRYNKLNMISEIVEVDYPTGLKLSETLKDEDCIPKSWIAEGDSNYIFYPSEENTLVDKIKTAIPTTNANPTITIGSNAVDGNDNTYLETYSTACIVDLWFKKPIKITQMQIKALSSHSGKWVYIYASNDNNTWISLYSGKIGNQTIQSITIDGSYYKYYRIESLCAGSSYARIYEIKVDQYYEATFGENIFKSSINIPLTSYENGKIVNIECGRIVDEAIKGNIVPTSGWKISGDMYSENIDGTSISSSMSGGSSYNVWYVCDGADASYFRPFSSTSIISLTYKFPYKVKISKMKLKQNGLGSSTSINISAGNNITNLTTLFTGTGEYSNTQEVSLNGSLGYYQYYRLTISADSSSVPMIYVWQPSEVQGIIYDEFVDIYMNINNNGERCIKGKIKYGQRYNLVYTDGVWEIIDGIVTGRYASQYNDDTTVNIELGFKPKYVILFGSSNMVSSVGVSVSGTVSPSYIPRIISEFSNSDTLNDDGFTVALSTTGNGNVYHSFYYIAIR